MSKKHTLHIPFRTNFLTPLLIKFWTNSDPQITAKILSAKLNSTGKSLLGFIRGAETISCVSSTVTDVSLYILFQLYSISYLKVKL